MIHIGIVLRRINKVNLSVGDIYRNQIQSSISAAIESSYPSRFTDLGYQVLSNTLSATLAGIYCLAAEQYSVFVLLTLAAYLSTKDTIHLGICVLGLKFWKSFWREGCTKVENS